MPDSEGGWTIYGETTAYDNPWVRVGLVDVEGPDGSRFSYHVVELSPIALALIVDGDDRVLLLRKYRFPTKQWGYEMPGGMVDDGEAARASAVRETAEESGWRAIGEPEHLLSLEPLPGQVRAHTDVYLFRGAEHVGDPTDPEEVGQVDWVPMARIPELIGRGEILGSSTGLALLYYYTIRDSAGQP